MHITIGSEAGQRPVGRQVARATAATLAVVAVLALALQAAANTTAIAKIWWRIAGDRDIRLADGVTLPTGPATVQVPVYAAAPWPASQTVERIAEATGGPVREISRAESAALTDGVLTTRPWRTATERRYATPLGVVVVTNTSASAAGGAPTVTFFVGHTAAAQAMSADPVAALARLVSAWSVGPDAPEGLTVTSRPTPDLPGTIDARVTMSGVEIAGGVGGESLGFGVLDGRGRLARADISLEHVTGIRPVQVSGADQAFERVRHQSLDGTVGPCTVTSANLEAIPDSAGPPLMLWAFTCTDGGIIEVPTQT